MKVLLIVNPQKAASQTLAIEIKKVLESKNIYVSIFSYTDKQIPQEPFDIAFSLGGDGTVLFTARTAAPLKIPVLPVNLGTLGFIATVPSDEWEAIFDKWQKNTVTISRRIMLDVRVKRQGKDVFEIAALNDAVISASGIAKTIRLNAMTKAFNLAGYRSDGLIAATPTGSTAYSASAGGPILDPEMEAIILNPICPFTLMHRPLVMPASEEIIINIEKDQRSGILLTIDGQVTEALETGDAVLIRQAPYKAQLLASGQSIFYKALHTKLRLWG